jgi:hypothetical protein
MGRFKKGTKKRRMPKLAIWGPSGSGKTWTALLLAKRMRELMAVEAGIDLDELERNDLAADAIENAGGQAERLMELPLVIDTEHGAAEDYAHIFRFDHAPMRPPYNPDRLVKALAVAEEDGYPIVIVDSYSHFWNGTGGVLSVVDEKASGKFSGWKFGTPLQNKGIDAWMAYPGAVIICMRAKTEFAVGDGGKDVQKLGLGPEQRAGIDYEPLFTLALNQQHVAAVDKSRMGEYLPVGTRLERVEESLVDTLWDWLRLGVEPDPPAGDPPAATPQPGDADQAGQSLPTSSPAPAPGSTPSSGATPPSASALRDGYQPPAGAETKQRNERIAYRVLVLGHTKSAVAADEHVSSQVVRNAVKPWEGPHGRGEAPWHAAPAPPAATQPLTPPAEPPAASGPSAASDDLGDFGADQSTAKRRYDEVLVRCVELRPNADWPAALARQCTKLFGKADPETLDDAERERLTEELTRLKLDLEEKDRVRLEQATAAAAV